MTKAMKHMGRVKELDCALCGAAGPSDAHHMLQGRTPGRKSPDWLTMSLCRPCHDSIHGDRTLWRIYKKTEHECLNDTLENLYG